MKKVTRILGLCALVALATVSCKKNENTNEGGKSFFATINQPTNGAKTHIGDNNYLFWDEGEQIKVYTENGEAYGTFTNKSGAVKKAEFTGEIVESDKYVAFYPVTNITEDEIILTVNDQQTYVADNFGKGEYPMAAFNTGDDFIFRSPCAVVCLPLTGDATINTITLSDLGGKELAGNFNVNLNGFNPATWSTYGYNGAKESVVLDCKGQPLTSTPTNFYFVVAAPETVFESGIQFVIEYEGGSKTLTSTNGNSLNAETILTMGEAEINKPTPPIGDFTVGFGGADDHIRKVTFAPGNLWYDNGTWRLEDNQWGYHNETENAQGLFCWSNATNNYGLTFTENRDFVEWGNLVICKPNSDETYPANYWRTLTSFEQAVLLDYRESNSFYTETFGKKLHRAMEVNGVNCMVVAPDNYAGDIDSATWAELEAAGAFAMPMAGGYEPLVGHHFAEGTEFAWWSSTVSDGYSAQHVYYYWGNNIDYMTSASIYHMFSVRLVKNTIGWE